MASRSRGSSALWSMCETVVILLSAQDYHSPYCAVLFPPLPPPVAQTLLVFSTQTEFNPNVVCLQNREFRPLLSLPPLLLCCLVFLTLFLFSDLNCRRFQSLSPSKADPRESALGRGGGGSLCSIMFACRWDKIDEMLCLAGDLSRGLADGCWEKPLSKTEDSFSRTLYFLLPRPPFHFSLPG